MTLAVGEEPTGMELAHLDRDLAQLYRQRCSTWARQIQRPGDIMAFAGEARLQYGRFPVVHKVSGYPDPDAPRTYAVIKPSYSPEQDALILRREGSGAHLRRYV